MSLAPQSSTPLSPAPLAAWRLHDAKAKFSAIVDSAMRGTPQFVTRRGQDAVVVLAKQDYDALRQLGSAHSPNFIDHLLGIPKNAISEEQGFERLNPVLREVDFQ